MKANPVRLPSWADEWSTPNDRCGCGASVVVCRGIPPVPHRVCCGCGWGVEICECSRAAPTTKADNND